MYTRKPLPRGFPSFFIFYEVMEEKKVAKNCNNCMATENQNVTVPYVVHESAMARSERHNNRLWIVILVLIGALIGTNLAWIIYESSFEEVVTATEEYYDVEQDADGGGDNNSIINGGVINGEAESKVHEENNDQNP